MNEDIHSVGQKFKHCTSHTRVYVFLYSKRELTRALSVNRFLLSSWWRLLICSVSYFAVKVSYTLYLSFSLIYFYWFFLDYFLCNSLIVYITIYPRLLSAFNLKKITEDILWIRISILKILSYIMYYFHNIHVCVDNFRTVNQFAD